MTLQFNKSQSGIYPVSPDTTSSKKYVYIRQNVVELTEIIDDVEHTVYEYEEAKLTKAEYEQYVKELSSTDTLETIENLKAENQSLTEQIDMLTSCLIEMSEVVYA